MILASGTSLHYDNTDDPIERMTIMEAYTYVAGLSALTNKQSGHYMVRCPDRDHEDKEPSCILNPRNDSWKCFACGKKGGKLRIVIAAGHARSDAEAAQWLKGASGRLAGSIFPEQPPMRPNQVRGAAEKLSGERLVGTYRFADEKGKLLYEVMRYEGKGKGGGRGKRFLQRAPRPNGIWTYKLDGVRRVPYRLPELVAAGAKKRSIIVLEGEKHADALAHLGLNTTTNMGGANWDWPASWARHFAGSPVRFVIGDADDQGRKAAAKRVALLSEPDCTVVPVDIFPDRRNGDDILDWMQEEGILADLKDHKSIDAPLRWDKLYLVPREEARARVTEKLATYYRALIGSEKDQQHDESR